MTKPSEFRAMGFSDLTSYMLAGAEQWHAAPKVYHNGTKGQDIDRNGEQDHPQKDDLPSG